MPTPDTLADFGGMLPPNRLPQLQGLVARSRSFALSPIRFGPIPPLVLDETAHFYFAQTGHSHFAATFRTFLCQRKVEMSGFLQNRNVRFQGFLQG